MLSQQHHTVNHHQKWNRNAATQKITKTWTWQHTKLSQTCTQCAENHADRLLLYGDVTLPRPRNPLPPRRVSVKLGKENDSQISIRATSVQVRALCKLNHYTHAVIRS